MRNKEYDFVDTDSSAVIAQLVSVYQGITGRTLQPADPDKLFLSWVADAIVKGLVRINYVGNQNIPSRAEGENLDALGMWIYSLARKEAQSASCTMRFYIVGEQRNSVTVPAGTRVTDKSQNLTWTTTADAIIYIGSTYADIKAVCDTPGALGNGYVVGQINRLIDRDNIMYFERCENITESDGGTDRQDDETYFQSMRRVLDSFSTAGAEGTYIFWAKSVSDDIVDVKAVRPREQIRTTVATIPSGDERYVFIGGNYISRETVKVYLSGSSVPAALGSDYFVKYENNLLTITLRNSGSLINAESIDVEFVQDMPGHVYIYALMKDGTVAGETIKGEILKTCSADRVRPLTDYVSVKDPEVVRYDIDFTYYVSLDAQKSLTDIQSDVDKQVDEYIKWQYAKLGRDINPSKLESMLMQTGVKRVVIRSPTFTELRSGDTFDVPQVATAENITKVNGGYENE